MKSEAVLMKACRVRKGNLNAEEHALFLGDAQACLAIWGTIKAIAERWGVSEKFYGELNAKMTLRDTLDSCWEEEVGD